MAGDDKNKEPITLDTLKTGVWRENPVFAMLLGLCPALAVSNTALNALSMGLASTFVLLSSSLFVSLLRNVIPKEVRIPSFIIIIATFVTVTDYAIQAISLDLYNQLGIFIQLIVVNCMIMGRCEAYASKNGVGKTLVNSFGMGAGFTLALFMIGTIREILGFGTFFGVSLFGPEFQTWSVFVLPPGAFFVVGLWLAIIGAMEHRKTVRQKAGESGTSGKESAHAA
ncbi:MAG: electron transport complex subunit RsxE [Spirochaetota bacterium]